MGLPVRLPGLTMNGLPDSDGDKFLISDIPGLDSADIDSSLTDHWGDGENLDYARFKQRELTIQGNASYSGTNDAARWRVRQKIETAVAYLTTLGATVYFDFPSPGVPVQMDCRKLDKLHFDTPNGTVQPFEIPLTAIDPVKYSQTLNTVPINNTTASLTNSGNYNTYFIATLQATATNPWFMNADVGTTTKTQLVGTFPVGTLVDMRQRAMSIPGSGYTDFISFPRTWWGLSPGSHNIQTSGNWSFAYRAGYV
jgi:hypothetical protein